MQHVQYQYILGKHTAMCSIREVFLQRSGFMALQTEAGLNTWSHGEVDVNKVEFSVVQELAVVARCSG